MPNALIVGFDKAAILDHLPREHFLLIDDGPLIDRLELPKRRAVTILDLKRHAFNPLKGMDYRKAREFLEVLNAAFPEGENTLTRRYANFHLLTALLGKPKRLDRLISRTKETEDAWQKIQTLLLSDVLEPVLNRPTNLSFKRTLIARLDRAVLGDFDAFVLGNLLISQFPGPVVVPDFGFYACPAHARLIRQDRLVAGINSFDEVPKLRSLLLQVQVKVGRRCTPEDAEILARYAGIPKEQRRYREFIEECIA